MKVYPYIERVYLVETLAQTQHSYNDVKHFFFNSPLPSVAFISVLY